MKTAKQRSPVLQNSTIQKIAPVKPSQKAKALNSLIVAHQSVVATILLVVEEEHRLIRIWWGDEGQNTPPITIDVRKERIAPSNDKLPRNTFRFQHRYNEKDPSRKIILVQSIDNKGKSNWESRVIEIVPDYTFLFYPMILQINGHFDTPFESHSEFDINVHAIKNNTIIFNDHWFEKVETLFQDVGTIYPIHFTVDESGFTADITYSDEPIYIDINIKEEDNVFKDIYDVITSFPVGFDTSNRLDSIFHPSMYTGYREFIVPYNLNDGPLNVILRTEMRLKVPMDPPSEILTQE